MNRLFATSAVALLLGLAPALAAEDGNLPTQSGVSPEASKEATVPPSGSADTSGGAAEQSSAPPTSGAASGSSAEKSGMNDADQSSGAKEQSSAPSGSSAASTEKPNPSLGQEQETEQN
jgi:hypothetical protein